MEILQAGNDDCIEILNLQKIAYKQEAEIYNDYGIQPLTQSISELENEFKNSLVLKCIEQDKIIGSVRAYEMDKTCFIGKLMVHPDKQNSGIGKELMLRIQEMFPDAKRFELFTGEKSLKNIHIYEKLGYKIFKKKKVSDNVSVVFLEKPAN